MRRAWKETKMADQMSRWFSFERTAEGRKPKRIPREWTYHPRIRNH